jgi:hypothetical protein
MLFMLLCQPPALPKLARIFSPIPPQKNKIRIIIVRGFLGITLIPNPRNPKNLFNTYAIFAFLCCFIFFPRMTKTKRQVGGIGVGMREKRELAENVWHKARTAVNSGGAAVLVGWA